VNAAQFAEAERIIGHAFGDRSLLRTALTHPSYAAEHADADTYDRLEFLGDAVLGFVVAEDVFERYPAAPEGELTLRKHHAVAGDALAEAGGAIGLDAVVMVGVGADAAGDRQRASVLENTVEALIGAIYLDAGLEAARGFVVRILDKRLSVGVVPQMDAKGALQQHTQARGRALPTYRLVDASGPVHKRTFTVEVIVDGKVVGTGRGGSKRAAEKAAAAVALDVFGGGLEGDAIAGS
jgi:ribonuclease-3